MTIKLYSQLNIMLVLVQVEEANINITKPANKLKQNLISYQKSSRSKSNNNIFCVYFTDFKYFTHDYIKSKTN